ncbi:MAG: hypothetical protein PHU80_04190 [Kiritimatiellae bacterium]|nr:hypothetical protein [Kiritimatiellia bacterium]
MLSGASCGWLVSTVVFCCFLFFGCKRRNETAEPELPLVQTNRAADAVYIEGLKDGAFRQMAQARERVRIAASQQECMERVRAALPEDAGDEALRAALGKDEEWLRLEAEAKTAAEALARIQSEAKAMMRARMDAEAQAVQDVRGGKARAIEPERRQ